MLEQWQTSWKNSETGRKIYNIMPSVSLRLTNWIRENVIFFSEHGPFPAYLKWFHLLPAIFAVVVELTFCITMPRIAFSQCLEVRGSQFQTSNKNG
ncbi:hypothetical protein AVEN_203844-1 [Araneus ventricosus]|uniref:Uncharacterized protein n=1 Tax=Araneus ventricosus TaxID=182803 RepID=A0A4Y2PEC9_ARAVE|nr:hypothetical protein AVEN_95783-1 [Araneus ventricosus]GBN48367.1 hypothetical protein AVEN_144257-1 [Araneus ventricosus]GBN48376.1 hypothetical protein AVEN_203844-1 [Araneus ventricosus]